MPLKLPTIFTSLLSVITLASFNASAVLPAVATNNTSMDNSIAIPLIPQIVPSIAQPTPTYNTTAVASTLPAAPTMGQNATQRQLQTKLTAALIMANPQGGEMLTPITSQTSLPKGSIIEYHGYIINNTPERVKALKATFDIPAGTELQTSSSVAPQPAYGSNDGQRFNYMPIKSSINGVLQEVPTAYYKAVQWDIAGLGLNEVAEVKYRVVIK